MRVLLDTCVLSELWRKGGSIRVRNCVAELNPKETFISVLTVGEISIGIHLLKESKKRRELEGRLRALEQDYRANILTLDMDIMKLWGEMLALSQKKGKAIPASDGLIAATAQYHNLQVMTRKVSDFEMTGVGLVNPWE